VSTAVLVVAERVIGDHPDVTFELLGKGRELADSLGGELGVVVLGEGAADAPFGIADVVYAVEGAGLGKYAAPNWEAGVAKVIESAQPKIVLLSTGTIGIDLAGSLAARFNAPLASYAVNVSLEGDKVIATSQLYGGKLLAEVELDAPTVVVTVIPGSLPADAGRKGGSPRIESVDVQGELDSANQGVEVKEPEASGVDITAAPMLVSVGRGIGSEANLELVQELADALKVPLSASRPIIDQGWLPKPHQVGKSGKKVKPTIYLSFGISGAPEHLEGMRTAEMIIACNTDPKAPIFEVAHYGTTVDLFDLVPALVERLGG
jgi:electron transfer flavoprotein alpha subunit